MEDITVKRTLSLAALLALVAWGTLAVAGPPQAKPVKPVKPAGITSVKPPASTHTTAAMHGPSVKAPKTQTVHAAKPVKVTQSVKPVKTAKATDVKSARTTTGKPAKTTTQTSASSSTAAAGSPGDSTAPPEAPPRALPKNEKLQAKLLNLLPVGTDLKTAAMGFKNQGQFVAAVHVSYNLGIPFADLKAKMVDEHLSLGQAIQALRPSVNATDQARRAEGQASADLGASARKGGQ